MSNHTIFPTPVRRQTMAEQMAETIQNAILSGTLESGNALPTEPELAEQFGVSRAVVRDATRILMARGLIEVQHGRGAFVTPPDNKAFGEALLLALRRVDASAWDVEQFEQLLFPQIVAQAAASASDQELARIQQLADEYLDQFARYQAEWQAREPTPLEQEALRAAYRQVGQAIFDATHNRLIQQLGRPLLALRNLRDWTNKETDTIQDVIIRESKALQEIVDAIGCRDTAQAQKRISRLMALPPEAVEAMRRTPVGEVTRIPIPQP